MVIKVTTCTLATSSIPSVASLSGAVVRATVVRVQFVFTSHTWLPLLHSLISEVMNEG